MTISVPFQQQFTYRKLGYLYFQDSLSYREVLEQNPQWNVTELPPVGAQLQISSQNGAAGGLSQGNFIFGLSSASTYDQIFPYETEISYTEALNRYTLQGVVERDKLNGVTLDSTQSITGEQSG
jgi:hypothetical protein